MGTLFDYLDWRGDLLFSEAPLNEVDNLILSLISYVDFDAIVPADPTDEPISLRSAARQYLKNHKGSVPYLGKIVPPEIVSLLAKAAKSKRFAGVGMIGYVNHIDRTLQIQFCAVTFLLGEQKAYVAYRGTDDTLIGWKENFNMSFLQPVPAQREAVIYLERMAARFNGSLYVGGHSKGGNLAVYAAVRCDRSVQSRILRAFNNDGPGFDRPFIEHERYRQMRKKIHTVVPHSSVVGMLLEHEESYEVVKSNATGLFQHNGCSWEVLGGSFVHLNTVTEESRLIDRSLKEWLNGMSAEEREHVVDSIFETLSATGAETLTELTEEKLALVKAWNNLEPQVRNVLLKCIGLLIRTKIKKKE